MLVFWKQKLVLLAVPKTGTTALEDALLPHADAAILNPPNMKHTPLRRYRSQLAPYFEDRGARPMEVMAIIREPLDWLGSWYRYRARPAVSGKPVSTEGMSFDTFVDGWLQTPEPEFARVGRQSRFVSTPEGEVGVDHLFAYEALPAAVSFLEDRLGVDLALERRNASPKRPVELSERMEQRLRREAADDFALWQRVFDA